MLLPATTRFSSSREKEMLVADSQNQSGLEGTQSVSALGLRWAALRGMLNSPLITVEDQRPLRDELVRELAAIERDFGEARHREIRPARTRPGRRELAHRSDRQHPVRSAHGPREGIVHIAVGGVRQPLAGQSQPPATAAAPRGDAVHDERGSQHLLGSLMKNRRVR